MDSLADEYDRWFDSPDGKELFQIELACVRDVTGDALGRWLEVGVGTGRFAAALGIREGLDRSEPALVLARGRGIDARQGKAEQLPYTEGAFDGVLLYGNGMRSCRPPASPSKWSVPMAAKTGAPRLPPAFH